MSDFLAYITPYYSCLSLWIVNFVGIGIFLYLYHLVLALLLADIRTLNEIKSQCFSSRYISGTFQKTMQVSDDGVNDTPLELYKCITSTTLISGPKPQPCLTQ